MDGADSFLATVKQEKDNILGDYVINVYDAAPKATPHLLWSTTLSMVIQGQIQSIKVFKSWSNVLTVALLTKVC
jgi:hypothetical protein